jgi:hypothetical protein
MGKLKEKVCIGSKCWPIDEGGNIVFVGGGGVVFGPIHITRDIANGELRTDV